MTAIKGLLTWFYSFTQFSKGKKKLGSIFYGLKLLTLSFIYLSSLKETYNRETKIKTK